MPPSRNCAQQRGEPLLLHVAQSGRRLVEQQQHRIDAQRARDLDDALLAERERCRRAGAIWSARPTRSIWRAASASSFASSARSRRSMLASAPAWPRRCAPIATFSSTVMSGTSLTCWKVREMPSFDDLLRRRVVDLLAEHARCVPPVARSTPVIRLKVVLLPAPFGPISATISRAWTSKETSLTAITPPNCLRALSISSSTLGAPGGARARRQCQRGVRLLARRLERQAATSATARRRRARVAAAPPA